jgi:hypothetical protein
MSSRVALLRMERAGLVQLPAPQTRNGNGRRPSLEARAALALPSPPCTAPVSQLPGLRLEVVATPAEAALYRQMMDRYHYLGHTPLAGAQLRYVIRCQTRVVGGLGFGASAWSVAVRDRFIGWSPEQRQKPLHLMVNHSRFLLLPGAGSPNLASCVGFYLSPVLGLYCPTQPLAKTFTEYLRRTGHRILRHTHLRGKKAGDEVGLLSRGRHDDAQLSGWMGNERCWRR